MVDSESNYGESEPLIPIENFHPLPDGSYEIEDPENEESEEEIQETGDFYENLAHHLDDSTLTVLSGSLLDAIREDKESRSEWEKTIQVALKYLGYTVEESRKVPFMSACSAFDTTMGTAHLNSYSIARAELFPPMGPARSEIIGIPTPETEDEGERVKTFLNYFLTQMDEDYYPDSERLLMYLVFFGCAFRKVYQDPVLNRPCARFIKPENFIVDHNATSILSSSRITEVMFLTRKEIMLRQASGDFIDFDIPGTSDDGNDADSPIEQGLKRIEGINKDSHENKNLFKYYESHVELTKDQIKKLRKYETDNDKEEKRKDIPKPYVVTICSTTKKVVSIKRNWKEADDKFTRMECFVHYYYLPGFGMYGLGVAHLMCSNAIVLTSVLRQLIDAGTLKNFPGGLKKKTFKAENNDSSRGPGEFTEIDTGGDRLQDGIMLMPYSEPSQVLMALRGELKQDTAILGSTLDKTLKDLGSNAPVGTTLAMLEVDSKMQSTVLRSMHCSLGRELKLLFNLFAEYLPEEPYPFAVPGKDSAIMKKDFSDRVNIVPVSDPNVLTTAHRLMRNEALLKLAQSAPQIHDIREAFHRMYSSMNVDNIDKLLPEPPKPQALDPVTENMNIMVGKPVTTAMFQDDASHIAAHKKLPNDPMVQSNPAILAAANSHIQRHEANQIFKEMHHEQAKSAIEQQAQKQLAQMQQQIEQEGMMRVAQGGIPFLVHQETQGKIMMAQQQIEQQVQQQISQIQPAQLSPEQEEQIPLMPEIQNRLAKKQADEITQEMQEQAKQQQEAAANQLDPNKVMMADIEQHREASHLKDESDKLKAETEAFKSQLKYESDMARNETQREIASERNEVNLAIEELKHPDHPLEY